MNGDGGGRPTSRQVLRAAKRAAEKLSHTTKANDQTMASLKKMQHMLYAIVRGNGRVRIPRDWHEGIPTVAKLAVKVEANGDLMVSYVEP